MAIKFTTTFDAGKLAKALEDTIIDDTQVNFGKIIRDETIRGLDSGTDIYGRKFKPIEESTKEVRILRGSGGDKPLVDTGRMRNSVKLVGGKLTAETYGNNAHQKGFVTKNNPVIEGKQFFFQGKRIPARPWLHNEDSIMRSGKMQKEFQKLAKKYFDKFNRAFTK